MSFSSGKQLFKKKARAYPVRNVFIQALDSTVVIKLEPDQVDFYKLLFTKKAIAQPSTWLQAFIGRIKLGWPNPRAYYANMDNTFQ